MNECATRLLKSSVPVGLYERERERGGVSHLSVDAVGGPRVRFILVI